MKIFLLVATLLVIIGVVIGTYRFWLQGTHGEVGPAVVATIVTIAVIGLAIFTMIKVQEARHIQEFEEGRAPETAPEGAGT
jgi:hypothetical protein